VEVTQVFEITFNEIHPHDTGTYPMWKVADDRAVKLYKGGDDKYRTTADDNRLIFIGADTTVDIIPT